MRTVQCGDQFQIRFVKPAENGAVASSAGQAVTLEVEIVALQAPEGGPDGRKSAPKMSAGG